MRCGPRTILGCLLSLSGGGNRGERGGEERGGGERRERGEGREGFLGGNYEVWLLDYFGLFAK